MDGIEWDGQENGILYEKDGNELSLDADTEGKPTFFSSVYAARHPQRGLEVVRGEWHSKIYNIPDGLDYDETRAPLFHEDGMWWDLPLKTMQVSRCPSCGRPYPKRHQSRVRHIWDITTMTPVRLAVRESRYYCQNPACTQPVFHDTPEMIQKSAQMTDRFKDAVLFYGMKHSALKTAAWFHISDNAVGMILKQGLRWLHNRYLRYAPEELGFYPLKVMGKERTVVLDMAYERIIWLLPDTSAASFTSCLSGFHKVPAKPYDPLDMGRIRKAIYSTEEQKRILSAHFPEERLEAFSGKNEELEECFRIIEGCFPEVDRYVTFEKCREWLLYGTGLSVWTKYQIQSRQFEAEDRSVKGRPETFLHGGGVDIRKLAKCCEQWRHFYFQDDFRPAPGVFAKGSIYQQTETKERKKKQ